MSLEPDLQAKILEEYHTARDDAVARGKKAADAENRFGFPWSETIHGSDRRKLWVHERDDRPGEVRVRWSLKPEELGVRGGPKRPKPVVHLSEEIRDGRGRLRKRALELAMEEARALYELWLNPPQEEGQQADAPWTLRQGFEYAADPETGISAKEDWLKWLFAHDRDGNGNVSVSVWQVVDRIIGLDNQTWEAWSMEDARRIWRRLAEEAKARGDGLGVRAAEQIVGAIYTIGDHLRTSNKIPEKACTRTPKWRQTLKGEWHTITGAEPKPKKERYSDKELSSIVKGLRSADDPRLRMAGVYGLGFRRAHVVRVRRSHVDLSETGTYSAGQLIIPGGRGKAGGIVDLTPAMHADIERALTDGYLADLEEAYQAKRIADYYILPAGHFRGGRAIVKHHKQHLHKDSLYKLFLDFEAQLGIPHKDGRGWHGLRRSMSDQIAEETEDEDVRDIAQGFTPGSGARHGYMDKERKEKLAKAAEARNAALRRLAGSHGLSDAIAAHLENIRRMATSLEELGETYPTLEATEALTAADALRRQLETMATQAGDIIETDEAAGNEPDLHETIAQAIREEIERRGLNGKQTAALLGVSTSDVSAIRRGKSAGLIATDRLSRLLETLRSAPET